MTLNTRPLEVSSCHPEVDIACMYKFEDASFSRSREMIGPKKLKMGYMSMTTLFSGLFCHRRLELAMANLPNLNSRYDLRR